MDAPQPHLFKRLLKNNIFRLNVVYSVLFLIASLSMLGVAYVTIEKNITESINREVNAEISRFIGAYQSNRLGIKTQSYAYFIEHAGQKVAGNITKLPDVTPPEKDPLALVGIAANEVVTPNTPERSGKIVGKTITLPDKTKLFIGKNNYDATERREDILDALSTALLSLLLIGVLGGLTISFRSIKRIDRISRVSKSIVAGNLDLRVPTGKYNDDIEDLGRNLNNMLDRIDVLMNGMREVTNNIAHDLRTPLTRLRANIETIAQRSDGELHDEAEKALQETDGLLNTFSSLLRISQVESGAGGINKDSINLSELVHEVMDFYDVLAEEKQQHLSIDVPDSLWLYADKTLLSQAIVNLFTNAVKYTPENGRIRISLSTQPAGSKPMQAELIIHDSGNGVPEDDLNKITRRFYRLEKHRNTATGNGLGLSMVKAIVDAHRGELIFANDVGLKAIIRLPLNGDS